MNIILFTTMEINSLGGLVLVCNLVIGGLLDQSSHVLELVGNFHVESYSGCNGG